MSVTHSDIYCTQCNFKGRTTILNGGYWYHHEGVFCALEKQYGWCYSCDDLVPMEWLENLTHQLESSLDDAAEQVRKMVSGKVRLNFTEANRTEAERAISAIKSIKLKYQIHSERKGQERCLRCGSHNVEPAEALNHLRQSIDELGQTATRYKHPGCGGEFILVPASMRLRISYQPKCYSFHGEYLGDELPVPELGFW